MKVEGLPIIMGTRVIYTKEGFRLIKDKTRAPTPGPAIPAPGRVEQLMNPPRIKERYRVSNSTEFLYAVMDNMLAAGHPYFVSIPDEEHVS
jgi:hypothetical protein